MLFVLQLELLISDLPMVGTFESFRSLPDITSQERTSLSTQLKKYCPLLSQSNHSPVSTTQGPAAQHLNKQSKLGGV